MTARSRHTLLVTLATVALVAGACAGADGPATPTDPPAATAAPTAAPTDAPTADGSGASSSPSATMSAAPVLEQAWATAEVIDVATGSSFRLADLAGRTVIIETMAIWCSNCLSQQRHVYDAMAQLDPDRVVYVVIDVDPNETAAALATYRDRNGFTGTYVVANRDLARALAAEFGDQVLNPPSTPMILIGADGRVTLTDYGQKSPDRIVELAREHGA
ncbi:MAG: redoxin family protein [Chloroflexota bacterium]